MVETKYDVTIVSGFLEAGKTTFINNKLLPNLKDKKVLIIKCEEGEVDYVGLNDKSNVYYIEYSEDFNRADLKELAEKYKPEKIIIELNGLWQLQYVQPAIPTNFTVNEFISIIDSKTFAQYTTAFGQLMSEKIRNGSYILFNRCTRVTAAILRNRNIRLMNPTKNMFLEFADHREPYDDGSLRPKSFTKKKLVIEDYIFGQWFTDFSMDPSFYLNKTVTFSGFLVGSNKVTEDQFVCGRNAMVCCANDMVFLGMLCQGKTDIPVNSWIEVTGKIKQNKINPTVSPFIVEVKTVEEKPVIENPIVS